MTTQQAAIAQRRAILHRLEQGPATLRQLAAAAGVPDRRALALLVELQGKSITMRRVVDGVPHYELWTHVTARMKAATA